MIIKTKNNIIKYFIFFTFLILSYQNVYSSYDFCSDESFLKYTKEGSDTFKLNNDDYKNDKITEISTNTIISNKTIKIVDNWKDDIVDLFTKYNNDTEKKLIIDNEDDVIFNSFKISAQNDTEWIKTNIKNYWFTYKYKDNNNYIMYVSKNISKDMELQWINNVENYLEIKKINCINNTETDNDKWDVLRYNTYKNPPWTYSWWYDFLTKDFLNVIKANLVVSDSLLDLENNLKNRWMWKFEEDYFAILEMIKNDNTLSAEEKDDFLKKLWDPWIQFFISNMLPAILLIESGWNTKMNPWNEQWLFQLYSMQKMANNNSYTRTYFTPANKIKDVYKKHKELTKEDFRYQLADIWLFMYGKWINSILKTLNNNDKKYSYYWQLDMILKSYDGLSLNEEELNDLKISIITKDSDKVNSFIDSNKRYLAQYNIYTAEDIYIWLEQIKVAIIWTHYNWFWNNGWWRKTKIAENFFDNNYVSNSVKGWNCFWTIWYDWWTFTNPKKTEWLVMNYLQYNYPQTSVEKQLSFISLIKQMEKNKLLYAFYWEC